MAWEPDKHKRTLLIEDHGKIAGKQRYRISPMARVERGNGEVYLEPLPGLTPSSRTVGLYEFSAIEIVSPPAPNRNGTIGGLAITGFFPESGVRSSHESAA